MAIQDMLSLIYGEHALSGNLSDFMRVSNYDELFELDLTDNSIRNLYHTPNKYYLPMLSGAYSEMHQYASSHYIHPDDLIRYMQFMNPKDCLLRCSESVFPGVLSDRFRFRMADGNYSHVRYLLVTGTNNGVPQNKVHLYMLDIQNQMIRNSGAESVHISNAAVDPLTGLCLSEDFFRRAARMWEPEGTYCCIAVDIGQFTLFNAVYGRSKGDQLLAAFGKILQDATLTHNAVCGFFGQDDFAIFAEYNSAWISSLYQEFKDTVFRMFGTVGYQPIFGIYRLNPDESVNLTMYDRAVTAMQEAKNLQTERIVEYTSISHRNELEDVQLLVELQKAIGEGRVDFYLQPQCRISTGKIIGAEALVRWRNTDGMLIPPSNFIPILERNGFIADLDKLVWEKVFSWLRSLLDRSIRPVPVSINISQMDILSMDVVSFLCSMSQKYRIPPKLVKVEVTESFYAERSDTVQAFVKALAEKGFTTMMDDFGSGYSSLNMLENVRVDVLKLDMAFMRESNVKTRRGVTILESIVNMAKMMGLPIIIEGVESEQQIRFLNSLGCRYAQGYYFYRPMRRSDFEELLCTPVLLDHRGIIGKANEQFHVREFLDENTFTDAMLNNILGAVAFYSFDGTDLSITRFNQQFYKTIGDARMESRQQGIQNYVVEEDRPQLLRALEDAVADPTNGGSCEIRFYKSNGDVFWFHMRLYHLKNEDQNKIFYGQIEDVTELRQRGLQFLDAMRQTSSMCMRINLDLETIQYVNAENKLMDPELPTMPLAHSIERTCQRRIEADADKQRFREFFNITRLQDAHRRGVYYESLKMPFILKNSPQPVEFSTYYLRYGRQDTAYTYIFVREL